MSLLLQPVKKKTEAIFNNILDIFQEPMDLNKAEREDLQKIHFLNIMRNESTTPARAAKRGIRACSASPSPTRTAGRHRGHQDRAVKVVCKPSAWSPPSRRNAPSSSWRRRSSSRCSSATPWWPSRRRSAARHAQGREAVEGHRAAGGRQHRRGDNESARQW